MKPKELQNFENTVIRLDLHERENPYPFLTDFFREHPLRDAKEELWGLVKAALTSKQELTEDFERSNALSFYELLDRLLEVAFIINERVK